MLKIYLAHPLNGLSGEEIFEYYNRTTEHLKGTFEIFSPMLGKGYLRNETKFKAVGYGNPASTNHAIKERDQWMVKQSDIVFVDFTGAKSVSIGCCMELAWGDLLNKHTVVVVDEKHYHAFVLECADIVFNTYQEAIEYLVLFGKRN